MAHKQQLIDNEFVNMFLVQYSPNNTDMGYGSNDPRDSFMFYFPKNKVIITKERYEYYIKELDKCPNYNE